VRDRRSQVPRSQWADSLHLHEVGVTRVHDCLKAAEAPEQCTCRHRRDAGNGCEDALCGRRLGPLRVHGAVSARRSPRCAPRDASGVERRSFDEQERPRSGGPQPPQLAPESPRREREVQIADGLPLHERRTRAVVGERQPRDPYLRSEATQLVDDCRGLVDVDVNANHLKPHARMVPTRRSRISADRSREVRTT
jgi:hypothetical protein